MFYYCLAVGFQNFLLPSSLLIIIYYIIIITLYSFFFIFWVSCVLCELVFARYCSSLFLFFLYLLISGDFMRLWKIHSAIFLMIKFEWLCWKRGNSIHQCYLSIYHQREILGFNPQRGASSLFLVFNISPHFQTSCVSPFIRCITVYKYVFIMKIVV